MIPYGKHDIIQEDIDAVVEVLKHKFLTQGDTVPVFEQALCDYTGAKYCVAVNSGTSGLHVACLAAGIGPGDLVWTSPNSFVASANCARYCGADIDFVDIDPHTHNMCLSALAEKMARAEASGRLPKALVVVHFAGLSCDMQAIKQIVAPYGVVIIEDAAHALGGRYRAMPVGSCQYSDFCVLSFHPVKSITTAEGGAVLCNDPGYAQQVLLFAKHGVTRQPDLLTESHGPWYYQQHELGFNYRLSDIHAALGLSQLKRLDDFVQQRRKLAHRYHDSMSQLPLQLPEPSMQSNDESAWHLYMVVLQKHDRAKVFEQLKQAGIGVNVHYIPIHLQPYYRSLGFDAGQFPNAEQFYWNAITLPLYPSLTLEQQDRVIKSLSEALQ